RIKSPALDRAKQGIDSLKQMKLGDSIGGLVNVANVYTGTVVGLAGNQGTKLPANEGKERRYRKSL
ncbi:hypothetical protein, partial [Fusobacterium necrophorum]|uniref:hypothetical protein n=1 Tax=Fusobacterium necrophorum TaxID=859 RepID=UPI000559BCB1